MSEEFRVVLTKDDGMWFAQGLEHDICASAENLGDLIARFELTVKLECDHDKDLSHIAPAPKHFHDLWERRAGEFRPKSASEAYSMGVAA